jgi:hypothetical protein
VNYLSDVSRQVSGATQWKIATVISLVINEEMEDVKKMLL